MSARMTTKMVRWSALAGLAVLLAACETRPVIRAQAANDANLAGYHTYAFVPKPGTDKDGYKTLTTQTLERAVGRELQARGYTPGTPADAQLLVNFNVKTHDRVESEPGPAFGVGYYGYGPRYGYGLGLGNYYNDIQTVTDGSLIVDVVDRSSNNVVWSGTAVGRLTAKVLDNPAPALERAVADLFARYPVPARAQ